MGQNQKGATHSGLSERGQYPKTVGDLRSLSTWPPGLMLNFPRLGDRHPESVVEVELAP